MATDPTASYASGTLRRPQQLSLSSPSTSPGLGLSAGGAQQPQAQQPQQQQRTNPLPGNAYSDPNLPWAAKIGLLIADAGWAIDPNRGQTTPSQRFGALQQENDERKRRDRLQRLQEIQAGHSVVRSEAEIARKIPDTEKRREYVRERGGMLDRELGGGYSQLLEAATDNPLLTISQDVLREIAADPFASSLYDDYKAGRVSEKEFRSYILSPGFQKTRAANAARAVAPSARAKIRRMAQHAAKTPELQHFTKEGLVVGEVMELNKQVPAELRLDERSLRALQEQPKLFSDLVTTQEEIEKNRRAAASAKAKGGAELTPTQIRDNLRIDAARKRLEELHRELGKEGLGNKLKPGLGGFQATDPQIKAIFDRAIQRKTGDDPDFESVYRVYGAFSETAEGAFTTKGGASDQPKALSPEDERKLVESARRKTPVPLPADRRYVVGEVYLGTEGAKAVYGSDGLFHEVD